MNPPRCGEQDYINFLIAAQKAFGCVEASGVQPEKHDSPSHDSINRLLHRLKPESASLWEEAKHCIDAGKGFPVVDDSTLDKLHARKIEPVAGHWSGKHRGAVQGINPATLLWTDGDARIPCGVSIYYKERDGKTKNGHFQDMLFKAESRGLSPECVLFDSWCSSLKNLKAIRSLGWKRLSRFHSNRHANPDGKGNVPLSEAPVPEDGTGVRLKGYGFVPVFRIVSRNGDAEYWAANDLETDFFRHMKLSGYSWNIEHCRRGLEQFWGVEKSMVRSAGGGRNHILPAIRAFLRLEVFSIKTGYSWFEEKTRIIGNAIRSYLEKPIYVLFIQLRNSY